MDKRPYAPVPDYLGMRAASVVFRISDQRAYDDAVNHYVNLGHCLYQPVGLQGYSSFSTNLDGGPGEDMELLILRHDEPRTDCRIIYYEVDGTNVMSLEKAHFKLLAKGHKLRELPHEDPKYPINTYKPQAYRSLLAKPGNYLTTKEVLIGLTINPPWPRGRRAHRGKKNDYRHGSSRSSKLVLLLVGLAAGLVLSPLVLSSRTQRNFRSWLR